MKNNNPLTKDSLGVLVLIPCTACGSDWRLEAVFDAAKSSNPWYFNKDTGAKFCPSCSNSLGLYENTCGREQHQPPEGFDVKKTAMYTCGRCGNNIINPECEPYKR